MTNQDLKLQESLKHGLMQGKQYFHSELAKYAGRIKTGLENFIDNLAPQLTTLSQAERTQKIAEELQILQENLK